MSLHTSLRTASKASVTRNVLKRHERARRLLTQGRWSEDQSAFGLAKVKVEKLKSRKAAAKEAPPEGGAEGAAATAAPAAKAPAAKAPAGKASKAAPAKG